MRRASSILVLFVLLAFGACFAVPAEDAPETAYDESEALPYIGTQVVSSAVPEPVVEVSVVSSAVPECVAEAPAVRPRAPRSRLGSLGRSAQPLDRRAGWAYPVSDSLTILSHSLRC